MSDLTYVEQRLTDYCKPWDQGGNGGSTLANWIQQILNEVRRLRIENNTLTGNKNDS